MPIRTEDVKIRASQRLTDYDDGGGYMTNKEIVDGNINNLFTDISRLDRTLGRVSLRKFFLHVDTDDTEMYSGAHLVISELAKDPLVNVALFATEAPGDTRVGARNRLESYVTLGPRFNGWLWGDQPAGSRALLVFAPTSAEVPEVGAVLCLFNNRGTASEYRQYVRVTKATAKDQDTSVSGRAGKRRTMTIEISDPLEATFAGSEMSLDDNLPTSIYNTIVSDAAKYYGVMLPRADIASGDVNINVESIYTQLVPTSQAETPMLGLTPGETGPIKQSGPLRTLSYTSRTWTTLNTGQAFVPGSLQLTIGSTPYTDPGNGALMQGSNQVGTIDYSAGGISFAASVVGAVSLSYVPGAAMSLVPSTMMILVQASNRGYNYVAILWPPPAPGTVTADYMAEGKWYRLRDDGRGFLMPDIPDTGTGKIEYAAGQVAITTAALPDVDIPIILRWGNPVEIVQMAGVVDIDIEPVRHTLAGAPVEPGSLSISWPVGLSETATATDDGHGNITGAATGWINYGNGEIEFTPIRLPLSGSDYAINHRRYATQTHTASGAVFTLPGASIAPGSLSLDVTIPIGGWSHTYALRDNGSGAMSAPGFSATLSQARASLKDSSQFSTSTPQSSGYGIYSGGSEIGEEYAQDSKEETVTLIAGGISASVDYVTGQVVFDLATATAVKDTISSRSAKSGSTSTVTTIQGFSRG